MPWNWVSDLITADHKKKHYWDARCPYMICPSNQPYRGAHKSRLKYVQNVAPLVPQYKCRDCGCLVNISIEQPDGGAEDMKRMNPALYGGKANFKFHV